MDEIEEIITRRDDWRLGMVRALRSTHLLLLKSKICAALFDLRSILDNGSLYP